MSAPYYQDEQVTVLAGDCLEVLRTLPDASVHAVVTDPPYGLEFMGREWDGADGFRRSLNPADAGRESVFGRTSRTSPEYRTASKAKAGMTGTGYTDGANRMDQPSFLGGLNPKCLSCGRWQRGGNPCTCDTPEFTNERLPRLHSFQEWCEAWARECLRVLKPGGHLLAFGGSRTWHRLAAAIEDAGFEIRDSIAWLYGSGFPKSLDVSKAIDKRPGVMRHPEFGKALRDAMTAKGYTNTFDVAEKVIGRRTGAVANWVKYQFPEAKWWPALRDLLDMDEETWGPVIAEAERAKTGKHDDGSPIGTFVSRINGTDAPAAKDRRDAPATDAAQQWAGWGTALKPAFEPIVVARKPLTGTVAANVLEHGTGALNIDATRVGMSDEDREKFIKGDAAWRAMNERRAKGRKDNEVYGEYGITNSEPHAAGRWPTNVLLDDTQAAELDRQSGVSVSRVGKPRGADSGDGWGMTATGAEYDDQGGASRFFPTFRYEAKAPTDERPRVNGIAHPTVKPLDLMRWLVRLATPPGGTVLDPFAGSGTTLEAALIEGFQCIGIEREADYLPLIKARITKPLETVLDLGGIA